MGNLLSVVVPAANIHDTKAGIFAAKHTYAWFPSIQKFCADAGHRGTFVSDVNAQLGLGVIYQKKQTPRMGKAPLAVGR